MGGNCEHLGARYLSPRRHRFRRMAMPAGCRDDATWLNHGDHGVRLARYIHTCVCVCSCGLHVVACALVSAVESVCVCGNRATGLPPSACVCVAIKAIRPNETLPSVGERQARTHFCVGHAATASVIIGGRVAAAAAVDCSPRCSGCGPDGIEIGFVRFVGSMVVLAPLSPSPSRHVRLQAPTRTHPADSFDDLRTVRRSARE